MHLMFKLVSKLNFRCGPIIVQSAAYVVSTFICTPTTCLICYMVLDQPGTLFHIKRINSWAVVVVLLQMATEP